MLKKDVGNLKEHYFVQHTPMILKMFVGLNQFLCISFLPHSCNLFSRSRVDSIVLIIPLSHINCSAHVFNVIDL